MTILVAGGSGFLGRALVEALRRRGHEVTILSRRPTRPDESRWSPEAPDEGLVEQVAASDAVINLAGASIGDGRWTAARKREILESRLHATRALTFAIAAASRVPSVFLSSSAVGYYGASDDATERDESSPPGTDFLARVCVDWEAAAQPAAARTRVVLLRTGVVFDHVGGALPRMVLPFKLGLGGPLGSGRQYMSWIYQHDWAAMVAWALERGALAGPLNATAPAPVTNLQFARALGNELRRPSALRVPAPVLRLLLGEMADALVLGGQRALPRRALAEGFTFRFGHIAPVLHALFG